ncbi:MAG: hypothetical protein Q8Q46_00615 [Candidatus Giovannonibacteria bacterium]|nr:hypothetical protein [Candidatus Giovannonibacteria bacterium]
MNEVNFTELDPIENYMVGFKCFNAPDGYQATFHIYAKDNDTIHYQIDFVITGTEYNTVVEGNKKSNQDLINEKYGGLENCFKDIGIKYIKDKIKQNNLKNKAVNILSLI